MVCPEYQNIAEDILHSTKVDRHMRQTEYDTYSGTESTLRQATKARCKSHHLPITHLLPIF